MWTFLNIVSKLESLKVGSSVYAIEFSSPTMATSAPVAHWRQAATSVSKHLGNKYSMRERINGLSQKIQLAVQSYL